MLSQSKAYGQHVALKILAVGKKKWKMSEMLIVKYVTLVVGYFLPIVPKIAVPSIFSFSAFDMQTITNISIYFA